MAVRARNPSPWGRATLNPQSPRARATDIGHGPQLRPGVPAGSLDATEPRAREKTRGGKRKKIPLAQKIHLYIEIYIPWYIYRSIFQIDSTFASCHDGVIDTNKRWTIG